MANYSNSRRRRSWPGTMCAGNVQTVIASKRDLHPPRNLRMDLAKTTVAPAYVPQNDRTAIEFVGPCETTENQVSVKLDELAAGLFGGQRRLPRDQPQIEPKSLKLGKLDSRKVRVRGIQNVVPLANDNRRHGQNCRSLPRNPGVSKKPGRNLLARAQCRPSLGQILISNSLDGHVPWNVGLPRRYLSGSVPDKCTRTSSTASERFSLMYRTRTPFEFHRPPTRRAPSPSYAG